MKTEWAVRWMEVHSWKSLNIYTYFKKGRDAVKDESKIPDIIYFLIKFIWNLLKIEHIFSHGL